MKLSVCLAASGVATALSIPVQQQAQTWPTAVPFWPQWPTRVVQVLNGTWQFGFSDDPSIDPASIAYDAIQTPNTTVVPGSFDVTPPGVLGPRGNAFYRSTHACTPGVKAALKFYAVNFYARVFVDGAVIGNHTAGGYTPFELIIPACSSSGVRELVVVVNNQANYTLSPTNTGGDFYFYSGIIRPVIVTELPTAYPFWIDYAQVISVDAQLGIIDVRVVFGGNMSQSDSVHLSYAFNGQPLGNITQYAIVNNEAYIAGLTVPDFKPWTLGQGNLFTLQIFDHAVNDSIIVRSGVRVLGVDPDTARVTINGELVKLVGFNRHTMWPDTGASPSIEQEAQDVALLKGINANYVRGAHYPQSQSFLDMLDEAGIVIWEEALGPGVSTSNTLDPYFMANHLQAVSSMVATSSAHPSVIIHGFFNEGPSSDPAACVGYAASAQTIWDRVRTPNNPPSRFVTWANNHLSGDACIAYEDVISFNSYPGWYDHQGNVSYVSQFWGEQITWVEQNWPRKPFFVSETGGGAVYEWTNDTAPYPGPVWSQAFQRNLVSADAEFLTNNTRLSGLTIWQFSDIKANDGSTKQCGQCQYAPHPPSLSVPWNCTYIDVTCGRPGGENHKGTVDFWRRTKEEYPVLASIYAANGGIKL